LRYLFEEYAFDTDRRELHRGANAVAIAPQVFDLLDYLIRNRERVVTKDDIIDVVWNGRSVSDAALTTRLNVVRSAIGDSGEEQRLIKTLPRKGFRFVGAVREEQRQAAAEIADEASDAPKSSLTLSDRPSIAILPFTNLSSDPEQEYFADGMVDEITTALSRFKWLFVIARNSSFTFKGKAVDVKEVGRKLGVRYVLEGSVRKASGKVRIAGQLIDAVTDTHIWADRFERDMTDVFSLQDEVTVAVVSAIEPKLLQTEIALAARRRPENLTAYDYYLRARQQFHLASREATAAAVEFASRAADLDPRFALSVALAAHCHMDKLLWGYAVDPQFERQEAVRLSRLALSIDNSDPETLASAALISAFLVGDRDAEIEMADRAVALNPNSSFAWLCRGWVYRNLGLHEEALLSLECTVHLNPLDPLSYRTLVGMAASYIELRRFDEAVAAGKKARRENPSWSTTYRFLAAAFAHLGRDVEAREAAARQLELDPTFTVSAYIARIAVGGQHNAGLLIEGLRKADLPE
jgi:TolB-like protein